MLHTCCVLSNFKSTATTPSQARLAPSPAQPWRPRTPHTCCVLTRKRTAWRVLVLVEALMWVWAQGELGVLSEVRLGRWSWVPLSWASWRRYSSLRWRPSWRESRDWSCNRSMEPSKIMESEGRQRKKRGDRKCARGWDKGGTKLTAIKGDLSASSTKNDFQ